MTPSSLIYREKSILRYLISEGKYDSHQNKMNLTKILVKVVSNFLVLVRSTDNIRLGVRASVQEVRDELLVTD